MDITASMEFISLRNSASGHPHGGHSHCAPLDSIDGDAVSAPSSPAIAKAPRASVIEEEAFTDLLRLVEAAYFRDLGQLELLSQENLLLKQKLLEADGATSGRHNGYNSIPHIAEPESGIAGESLAQEKLASGSPSMGSTLPNILEESNRSDSDSAAMTNSLSAKTAAMTNHLSAIQKHSKARSRSPQAKTFKLQTVWAKMGSDMEDEHRTRPSGILAIDRCRTLPSVITAPGTELSTNEGDEVVLKYDGILTPFLSPPGSPYRIGWDFIGATFIFYDLFSIPLQVFDIDDQPYLTFSEILDWTTLLFWTLNVCASLTVGYVDRGMIVMEPDKILRHYLKGWFWVDLVVVVPDWVFTIAAIDGDKSGAGSSVKLLRILRLVRMVRLLRLLKLRKIMQDVNDHIDSEYASIIASIIKMILVLLAINHFIACAWYGLAALYEGGSTTTWIKASGFIDDEWYYKYATAFHWSITNFTPSSMSIQPHNMPERSFAVAIVVFALVGFSYLVGGIIAHIGQLRSMREDASKQFWNLRRYMRQNSVPIELSIRIQRYLEHAWQRKQATLQSGDIKILGMLSDQLSSELKCALALPHLSVHPLFCRLYDVSFVTNQRLANYAIDHTLLAVDDNLFIPGEVANCMYVVVKGRLQYYRQDSSGRERKEWVDKAEDWIAEPVLWTTGWVHLGLLTAHKECDLMTLDAVKFAECVKRNPQACKLVGVYSRNFLVWLNSEQPDDLSDIYQGEVVSSLVIQLMSKMWEKKEIELLSLESKSSQQLRGPLTPEAPETSADARKFGIFARGSPKGAFARKDLSTKSPRNSPVSRQVAPSSPSAVPPPPPKRIAPAPPPDDPAPIGLTAPPNDTMSMPSSSPVEPS